MQADSKYLRGELASKKTHHVSWKFPPDGLAASDGQVSSEKDGIGDPVYDETVIRDGSAPLVATFVDGVACAVEVLDGGCVAEHGDEASGDGELERRKENTIFSLTQNALEHPGFTMIGC